MRSGHFGKKTQRKPIGFFFETSIFGSGGDAEAVAVAQWKEGWAKIEDAGVFSIKSADSTFAARSNTVGGRFLPSEDGQVEIFMRKKAAAIEFLSKKPSPKRLFGSRGAICCFFLFPEKEDLKLVRPCGRKWRAGRGPFF